MKYASIRSMDISNGEGIGVSLFTQGCYHHCKGCFNPETWDFNGGKEYTWNTTQTILKLIKPDYITRFSILGGEPLEECNFHNLWELIYQIKKIKPDIKIWIWTGYTFDQLTETYLYKVIDEKDPIFLDFYNILFNIDVLVDGPFIQEQRDLTLAFRGSKNQRIIDMRKTLDVGQIVLYDI